MKKFRFLLLGFLVVFLVGSIQVFNQENSRPASNNDNYKNTLPEITINDNGNSGVKISYKFKGAQLSLLNVNGLDYYTPHIYGFNHMTDVGCPRLPARNLHIAIPEGSTANIEILGSNFKKHSKTVRIHPALALLPDCTGAKDEAPFEIDDKVYGTDADFPARLAEIVEYDTYRGVSIAVVQVRPLQINPVTGELKIYEKINFRVTFSGARSSGKYGKNSRHANDMVKNVVLNPSMVPEGTESTTEATRAGEKDYIMIVHSDFLAAAQDLATWKRQLGYSVEIVSQSSWTTTQVDDALKTRYNSWTPRPQYFLLVGDQGDVPAEYTGSRYTDLYYAEMEGSGYKPEMAYGRIFPSSSTDAQVIVDKIINYEKNPPTTSSFYDNTLACAYYQDDGRDSYADRRFTHTSEDIRNYMMGQGYGVNRVYVTSSAVTPLYYNNGYYSPSGTPVPTELRRPTFAWDGDAADIINYIDAGRFLVWHRDHGSETLWGDPYFTTSNIGSLNNGGLLPVVMSVNCLTGKFMHSSECFCERFLRLSGGGCVGIFGATELSYSGPNDGYAPGIIDAIWPDPGIDPQYGSGGAGNSIPTHDPIYTMGDILNHSKVAMEYLWGLHQTTWELHHWYGDPAMKIWTDAPTTTTATHDGSISGTSLQVTASNCADGIATLVYDDVLVGKTTLSAGGTGTITFSTLSGTPDTATLTIHKHNYKPYIATISVGGAPPVAEFSAGSTSVQTGGVINFTDSSTNTPTSWSWTFEGGTPATSTSRNPSVTYNTAGTYDVTLIATNSEGSDTETKLNYITVTAPQPPTANFTASVTAVAEGGSVAFTDTSTQTPTSWSWTFQGGTPSSSTSQNPSVTYNTAGTYDVTLVATNAAGNDTEVKSDYITVSEVLPTFGHTTVYGTSTTTANRRAMPFTMPENGTIQSVSMYHTGGSGNMILGVYDGSSSAPANRLGVTASTSVSGSTGWQTINLTTPCYVASGSTVWLAWVYESNPGIWYETGSPGRAHSGDLWSGGMPDPFGSSTQSNYIYSIYATYSQSAPPQYTVTVNTSGDGSVALNPTGGTYSAGTNVTLTATPDSGWQFDNWSGGLTGSTNPATITVNSNLTITANFSEIGGTGTVGNTTAYSSTSTSAYRRAMPFTMPENGTITSVSMYHTGGSGNMILAVYDGTSSAPGDRLAVTASTAISGSTGWQTINLTSSVAVSSGSTVWLAWVYESNPGIRYQTGSPGRYQSTQTWSGGMPDPFGSGSQSDFLYSIYATYNK